MVHQKSIIRALPFLIGSVAASPLELFERATCNRDNLFRCFIDQRYSTQASAYCAGLTPFTTTVATTTATETSTVWTDVVVSTRTDTVTSTTTVFTATVPSTTATVTGFYGSGPQKMKRAEAAAPPKCLTNGVTYPASRITSACSCIDVPAQTVSVTYTAGTATVTDTLTSLLTASATATVWETVSTVTTAGVATVTVPPAALSNLDFEQGNLNGWTYYDNNDAGWDGDVVSVAGANGQPTRAFRVINRQYLGFADLRTTNQYFRLKAGSRYRVSMSGKTTSTASNTLPNVSLNVNTRSNFGINANWYPLQNGVGLGNGWYRFSGEFTVPAQYEGDFVVAIGFTRSQNYVEHFVDNIAIEQI
ncbi:Putative carbohydrate-binding, CenC, Galactose-binding-like domain superfamily [Colletotrichum destructivum]|uniref:Carbohydrate-binding, CenC, Galactose-binding-like domain superfamily n=1 Tax=Colletotrichum destructivum TaxID=34406 RepID=A0AAX4IUX9_9PEZI|nr:Putative carbohydrate-binding, CenC, Galactose-binding-like domain superfamily [Colletotrichum destructivum]